MYTLRQAAALGSKVGDAVANGVEFMSRALKAFWADEQGITAIQYAMIAIICSVSIVVGLMGQRDGINQNLSEASAGIQSGTN